MKPPPPVAKNSQLLSLSLREKLAQLIIVRLGSDMPPKRTAEEDEHRVAQLLEACPLGGLVLFNGTYDQTPATLDRLQRLSRIPLLVGADLERGAGQQLRPFPLFPHAMAFDALGDEAASAVREFAKLAGQTSRAAGVHITFSPVSDVNSDPRNPIISTRAFSSDPRRVAELAAMLVEGSREAGMLSCAKHFPGHGDTHEDSHDAVPGVDAALEQLHQRELAPFRAAIAAGVPLVMTAHVRYPALDPTGVPATFSRPIITGLLRRELGFQGAVITDSLLMDGAKIGFSSEGELALAALNAGVDILLDLAEPLETLAFLEAAVESGRLPMSRVDESFERVMRLKDEVFQDDGGEAPAFDPADNRDRTAALAINTARRAAVLVSGGAGLLPFRSDRTLAAVLIDPFQRPRNMPPPPLGDLLRKRFSQVEYFEFGAEPAAEQLAAARRACLAADQALAAFVVKPAAWYKFGLPPQFRQWLQELAAARPLVAACLGAPQGLEPLAGAAAQICTFSDVPASQQALVELLLNQRDS